LYASILPPLVYALLGTSRSLSVGPVSVAALLVANALSGSGEADYMADAFLLAALSGAILLAMAALRLDVLVNFISHPTLSGFTSCAAILIILSQLGSMLWIYVPSTGVALDMAVAGVSEIAKIDLLTASLGIAGIVLIALSRSPLQGLLQRFGIRADVASPMSRAGPLAVIILSTALVTVFGLHQKGVAIVG